MRIGSGMFTGSASGDTIAAQATTQHPPRVAIAVVVSGRGLYCPLVWQ